MLSQERAERTRRRLITAAAEALDAARGQQADAESLPGLESISKAAGVSKGALYYHFRSKAELLDAVRDEARQTLRRLLDEQVATAVSRSGGLRAVLELAEAVARRLDGDPVCRAGVRLSHAELLRVKADGPLPVWMEPVATLLRLAADAGELRADVQPGEAALTMLVLAVGIMLLCDRNPCCSHADLVDRLWRAVLPTLAAPRALVWPAEVA